MSFARKISAATLGGLLLMAMGTFAQANASCVHTKWQNTDPNHVLKRIIGRKCGNNLSIQAHGKGACQFGYCELSWVAASQVGNDKFKATYVGDHATNKVRMCTHANGTMDVKIKTIENNGNTVHWFGNFKLIQVY